MRAVYCATGQSLLALFVSPFWSPVLGIPSDIPRIACQQPLAYFSVDISELKKVKCPPPPVGRVVHLHHSTHRPDVPAVFPRDGLGGEARFDRVEALAQLLVKAVSSGDHVLDRRFNERRHFLELIGAGDNQKLRGEGRVLEGTLGMISLKVQKGIPPEFLFVFLREITANEHVEPPKQFHSEPVNVLMGQVRPFLDETLGNVIRVEPLFDLPLQVFDRLRRFAVIVVNYPGDLSSVFPTRDQQAQGGNFHPIGRSIVVALHTVFGDVHDLKIHDLVLEAINQHDDAFLGIAAMAPRAVERTNRLG
jgi:hypothetical protein